MKAVIDVQQLLEKGAYFGHRVSRTNPKAFKYTYKAQNGIYIIDLFKTKEQIEAAMNVLFQAGKNNEKLLVIATKKIAKNLAEDMCVKNNILYLTEKWIGGFFTNIEQIAKNIKRINTWNTEKETGGWDSMIKHQRVKLEKQLRKMVHIYKGVLAMEKIPENILIIDVKKEKNALDESLKIKLQQQLEGKKTISIIGIADTNADPTELDYPIVANDDSVPTLEYILTNLLDSYLEGRKNAPAPVVEEVK